MCSPAATAGTSRGRIAGGLVRISREADGHTDRHPHDLRHTCASLAVSAGVNVLALQRMLGHKPAKVTRAARR
ncbi:MAG TPA: tyrosine-type recombinase/integrase [Mycobacterium sp.]